MTFDGISRRELLAGLTGVGAAGALTGLGTGALLSDTEGLAAGLSGGALDLEVTWSYPGSGASDSDASLARVPTTEAGSERTVDITVDLPQGSTDFNNAAFVWVRLRCPEESDIPADDVRVELSYAGGDLDGQSVLGPATLADLLSDDTRDSARTGVPLRATADDACLDTRDGGDPIRLALHIAVAEEYVGETAFHLPFEFVGHQCRHATATENPFARAPVGPCGSTGTAGGRTADDEELSGETETESSETTRESSETDSSEMETESTPGESTPEEPATETATTTGSESTETPTENTTTAQQPTDEQPTETTETPESTTDSADPSADGDEA